MTRLTSTSRREAQSGMVPIREVLSGALEKAAMTSPLNADLLALAKRVRG